MVLSPKVCRLCPPLSTWVDHVAGKHQHVPCPLLPIAEGILRYSTHAQDERGTLCHHVVRTGRQEDRQAEAQLRRPQ